MSVILLSAQIPAAGTVVTTEETDLGKVTALNLQCLFTAGSGGTSVKAYVQTRMDATNFFDIACFAHTTSDLKRYMSCLGISGVAAAVALTDAGLTDNTAINGFLGVAYRIKYVVVGTYTGGSITILGDFKN